MLRTELCDSLCDKIFQPTYRPLRPNVRPFLFHAYDPAWERPLDFSTQRIRDDLRRQQLVPMEGAEPRAARDGTDPRRRLVALRWWGRTGP